MNHLARHTLGAALAVLLLHCGGSVVSETRDAGSGQDSGSPGDDGGGLPPEAGLCEGTSQGGVPAEHRPSATTCTPSPDYGGVDAAPVTCHTSADCVSDASPNFDTNCVQGTCIADDCLADSDCPSTQLCVCAADGFGGDGPHINRCVPAACKVDSDCGPGRYCEPSRSYCGSVDGYNCTSPADTCTDPQTDCAACGGGNACDYAPQVGHFVCGTSVCNG
jgi:hypothetical protein